MRRSDASPHGAADAVTVHSMGGLGNQLFIYAAGLAAARAAGGRLRVDVGQHAARADRPAQLQELGLPAEYVDQGLQAPPRSRLHAALDRGRVGPACTLRESGFRYDDRVMRLPLGGCMFGYFQSWRYVAPIADEVRQHLQQLAAARLLRHTSALERLAEPTSVVMHVRRGDYLQPGAAAFHGLAGLHFYRRALEVLRRMGFTGAVHLVSDEPAAARAELAPVVDAELLPLDGAGAIDELLLMSAAPALITANSSFSWWSGWTGDRPGRPVLSPRPWFDSATFDDRDLLPPHWLTIGRAGETPL